jgi:hypothetical protein
MSVVKQGFRVQVLLTPSSRASVDAYEHELGQPRLRQWSWRPVSFQSLSNAFSKWSRYKSQNSRCFQTIRERGIQKGGCIWFREMVGGIKGVCERCVAQSTIKE